MNHVTTMKLHKHVWIGIALLASCAATVANIDPTGQRFPTVEGQALDGTPSTLPAAFAGVPTVILIGYVQGAQFDLDRWAMGLLQSATPARIVEVPTIPGLVPTAISSWIDSGMKSGIPSEDWPNVITVYGSDASMIAALTGNENGRNARVVLLDGDGVVAWFSDRGYSAQQALALDARVRGLTHGPR